MYDDIVTKRNDGGAEDFDGSNETDTPTSQTTETSQTTTIKEGRKQDTKITTQT